MISGKRNEAWPMYLAWPIPKHFMLGVIRWHVTCMLSLAGHWQDRRALSNHVCAHSVIPMWHVPCLQHLARASSEQSRSTTVLPTNHVIQIPQCLSGFVNHDYWKSALVMNIAWHTIVAWHYPPEAKLLLKPILLMHRCANRPQWVDISPCILFQSAGSTFIARAVSRRLSRSWLWSPRSTFRLRHLSTYQQVRHDRVIYILNF